MDNKQSLLKKLQGQPLKNYEKLRLVAICQVLSGQLAEAKIFSGFSWRTIERLTMRLQDAFMGQEDIAQCIFYRRGEKTPEQFRLAKQNAKTRILNGERVSAATLERELKAKGIPVPSSRALRYYCRGFRALRLALRNYQRQQSNSASFWF